MAPIASANGPHDLIAKPQAMRSDPPLPDIPFSSEITVSTVRFRLSPPSTKALAFNVVAGLRRLFRRIRDAGLLGLASRMHGAVARGPLWGVRRVCGPRSRLIRVWAANHAPSFFKTNRSNKRRRGASTTASASDEDVSMSGRETLIVWTDSASPSDVRTTAAIL